MILNSKAAIQPFASDPKPPKLLPQKKKKLLVNYANSKRNLVKDTRRTHEMTAEV